MTAPLDTISKLTAGSCTGHRDASCARNGMCGALVTLGLLSWHGAQNESVSWQSRNRVWDLKLCDSVPESLASRMHALSEDMQALYSSTGTVSRPVENGTREVHGSCCAPKDAESRMRASQS